MNPVIMYTFHACGHRNIQSSHRTTLEFTKDPDLTILGDCIIGVKADFDLEKLKEFIKDSKDSKDRKVKLTLKADKTAVSIGDGVIEDDVIFNLNPGFDDEKELVIRMGHFASKRTLGINANKSSGMLKRELKEKLKDPKTRLIACLSNL